MSSDLEDQLIEEVSAYCYDPDGYSVFAFPWQEDGTDLHDSKGPRGWQRTLNQAIGKHLQDPATRFQPFLAAIASGHGIGKSAEIGIVINWGMSCFDDCKVVYTANTETQLRTKTTPEISKWFRLSITSHWFKTTATAVHSVDPKHEKSWRADAVTWSKTNTEAFAGLHNKGKCIIVVFDEGSAIEDKVWDVTEGALTDENTVIIWLVFGNPTRNTGRFKECFVGKKRKRWFTMQIDSRDVEGTNKDQLSKWVEDYGLDSDFVKVRVRGMFPSASFKQFISSEDADRALGKHLRESEYNWAPKILTVDPAWDGDDEFVIGLRQGLAFKILGMYPKNDNDVHMANIIARFEDEEDADAVFMDAGYGTGILSVGKTWKRNWRIVWGAEKSSDEGYLNKRAEMWGLMKQWLKDGGAIPDDKTLYADITAPETVARVDGKIQLESKKDMKARGLPSPGRGDALALSFAFPVSLKARVQAQAGTGRAATDYDPRERD